MKTEAGTKTETCHTSWRNRLVIACIALGALAAAGPATAGPGTLRVDDDKLQCPEAQFASIQAAVAAAEPGDKVKVCPGLYNEIVTVPKTLELDGAGPDPRERTGDPTEEAVVRSFKLLAPAVVLEGFTIQGTFPSIVTSQLFSGYRVERNLVNSLLVLQTSGFEETRVRQNVFTDSGIFCSPCPLSRIEQNLLTGATGISVNNTANIEIAHNSSRNVFSVAIRLVFVTDARVHHNDIENASQSGIELLLATRVDVTHNRVENAGRLFGADGIFAASSSSILIARNTVVDGRGDGLMLSSVRDSRIEKNELERNLVDGIALRNARANLITHNKSDENGSDGIAADSNSRLNIIEDNHMRLNGEHDCHDDSVGPNNPPALVANIWRNNHGLTENRPGLCRGNDD